MDDEPAVSVALCTYQGDRFLAEQLESLLAQTRPPDEVMISDDASTDGTMELLQDFCVRATFAVHVHANEHRLGSTENFSRAMQRCTGDVIMLCDQDDIWYPTKIERLLAPFRQAGAPAVAFSDAELMDEQSRVRGTGLFEGLGFTRSLQAQFRRGDTIRVLCVGNVVPGATLAIDRRYLDLVLPVPNGWIHDAWFGIVVACVADVRMLDEKLIGYRLHTAQQIGVPAGMTRLDHLRRRSQVVRRMKKHERDALHDQSDHYRQALRRVDEHRDVFSPRPGAVAYLEGKARHFDLRARMPTVRPFRRRARVVAEELKARRYHQFSNGWVSVAKDVLLIDEKFKRRTNA